ncbi:MAG: hypothetical protein HYR56_14185 [Acidobacteria bacterium]|nr:hypothetical protein [Acidobacteriota bacterium]MBI3421637.1 hypothetical protein [Acidobacteriota bacterium]
MLMTKEEALAFKERWRLVNEFINEEIRQTPPAVKLRQLATLFQFGRAMGWEEKLRQGEEEAQARWRRLQEAYAQKA